MAKMRLEYKSQSRDSLLFLFPSLIMNLLLTVSATAFGRCHCCTFQCIHNWEKESREPLVADLRDVLRKLYWKINLIEKLATWKYFTNFFIIYCRPLHINPVYMQKYFFNFYKLVILIKKGAQKERDSRDIESCIN